LARIDNGEDLSLEEIMKIVSDVSMNSLEFELKNRLVDLIRSKSKSNKLPEGEIPDEEYNKLDKKTREFYAFVQLGKLIAEADEAIKRGDYKVFKKVLKKMKRYKDTEAYRLLKKNDIERLRQVVEDYKQSEFNKTKKHYLIGSSILLVTFCLIGSIVTIYRKRMKRRKLNRFSNKRHQ
jgi:hypothetical protein